MLLSVCVIMSTSTLITSCNVYTLTCGQSVFIIQSVFGLIVGINHEKTMWSIFQLNLSDAIVFHVRK